MAKEYNKVKIKNNMKVDREEGEEALAPKVKLQQLVDVAPIKVKRNLFSRLVSGILGPEGLPGIGSYVNDEIIVPAIKNIIVDAVTSGINMIMYKDGREHRPGRDRYSSHSRNRTIYRPTRDYRSRYDRDPDPREPIARPVRYGVEEYKITDRIDASHVLTSLVEHADRYDSVSVADYYDLIGVPSEHTDDNYGWTLDAITLATVVSVRGGYVIKFPAVEVI